MAKAKKPKDLMEKLADSVRVGLKHLPDSNQWDGDSAWDEYTSFEQDAVKKARRIMNLALELYEVYQELDKAEEKPWEIPPYDSKKGDRLCRKDGKESKCIHYRPINHSSIACEQVQVLAWDHQSPQCSSDKEKVTCWKCKTTKIFGE